MTGGKVGFHIEWWQRPGTTICCSEQEYTEDKLLRMVWTLLQDTLSLQASGDSYMRHMKDSNNINLKVRSLSGLMSISREGHRNLPASPYFIVSHGYSRRFIFLSGYALIRSMAVYQ